MMPGSLSAKSGPGCQARRRCGRGHWQPRLSLTECQRTVTVRTAGGSGAAVPAAATESQWPSGGAAAPCRDSPCCHSGSESVSHRSTVALAAAASESVRGSED